MHKHTVSDACAHPHSQNTDVPECWPHKRTQSGRCFLRVFFVSLAPSHWGNGIEILQNTREMLHRINRGVGVMLASQTVIHTEKRGDLETRAAPAYFTTCSATICSLTHTHTHNYNAAQWSLPSRNVPLLNRYCTVHLYKDIQTYGKQS